MKAIPTMYQGRQYRSRLEARWAAFFDLMHWQAEYEPLDFNGWIPDFVIYGLRPIYVEVKPVSSFPEEVAEEIDDSGCKDECLIVGTGAILDGDSIGWLREFYGHGEGVSNPWGWDRAMWGCWKGSERTASRKDGSLVVPRGNPADIAGFCHETGSFHDRITGGYDGGSHGVGPQPYSKVSRAWTQAGNLVQWRAPN